MIIYLNEKYLPDDEAKISIHDSSYLFGEGLFETFRSYDGKIPFLHDHLQRLEWSCTFLDFEFPTNIDFKNICDTLLEENDLKTARFKIMLSRVPATENAPCLLYTSDAADES